MVKHSKLNRNLIPKDVLKANDLILKQNKILQDKFLSGVQIILDRWCKLMETKYIKRQRKISAREFLCYMIDLLDPNTSYSCVISRSKSYISKSSLCKFRKKIPSTEFAFLAKEVLLLMEKLGIIKEFKNIYAADGSDLCLDKKLIAEGYSVHPTGHNDKDFAQALMSLISDVNTGIPYNIAFAKHKDERKLIMTQLPELKPESILILDRGYYSFELCQYCTELKIYPIFRMSTIYVAVRKSLPLDDQIVTITNISGKEQLKIRLVKYMMNSEKYIIGTTLFDKIKYPHEDIKNLYHRRWDIEEQFDFLKNTAGMKYLHTKSENCVKQELYLSFFVCIIIRAIESINKSMCAEINSIKNKIKFNSKILYDVITRDLPKIIKHINDIKSISKSITANLRANIICFTKDRSYDRTIKQATNKSKYHLRNLAKIFKNNNKIDDQVPNSCITKYEARNDVLKSPVMDLSSSQPLLKKKTIVIKLIPLK